MKELTIGVVGGGVVGKATARAYLGYVKEVRVFDIDITKRTHTGDRTMESDLIFLCIPERELDRQCSYFTGDSRYKNFVIKSTCPIGTTRVLAEKYGLTNIVHSPEFLTERTANIDAILPSRNIIGDPDWYKVSQFNIDCGDILNDLYANRFPRVEIHRMSSDESEAVKLMTNAFFSTKIAFFNEMYSLCKKLELDWGTVLAGILSDGRIAHYHTQVPGPDGKLGFGGKCLPKDLSHLIEIMDKVNIPTFLAAMEHNNIVTRNQT